MIDNPWGAFACWSSTLSVLANSDAIHGLLLTFRGPEVISMLLNPKVRLGLGHQQSQFGPVMARFLYYYLLLRVPE